MGADLQRVLYLEDDPNIAEIAQMAMVDISGLNVLHCASGGAAIENYARFQPDLLLFDVMLPDMDGVETLHAIREAHGSSTPVIFMTAKAQTHEQQKYMDEGALSVIVKPFDAFHLGDQLKSLWSARAPLKMGA